MNKEQHKALYGPAAQFSEHKEGETIVFFEAGQVKRGEIVYVRAPGPAVIGGKEQGVRYIVDAGEGMPSAVAPSEILEGAKPLQYFYALLATYGYPDSQCKSLEQAKNLATNVRGQVITGEVKGETKQLRVLSARVEPRVKGDRERGRVVGECEVVGDAKEEA